MTDEPIELPEDQVGEEATPASTFLPPYLAPPSSLTTTLLAAIEAPLGVSLDFPSKAAAERARFKFYDERKALRKRGMTHFDELIFSIEGAKLLITKFVLPELKEL